MTHTDPELPLGLMHRREFLVLAAATVAQPLFASSQEGAGSMYGLIGRIRTAPGQRDLVIAALLDGTTRLPGCLSYIVAKDPSDATAIWVTEVWDSEASHKASLSLPAVQAAIGRAKPSITGFGERFVTTPVGGVGLPAS
jgi:quinol monooxygenase YgiN